MEFLNSKETLMGEEEEEDDDTFQPEDSDESQDEFDSELTETEGMSSPHSSPNKTVTGK